MTPTESKAASTQAAPTAPKTVAKPAVKVTTAAAKKALPKPKTKSPVKAAAPAKVLAKAAPAKQAATKPVIAKPAKIKKIKMVRDSFTMPKPEFAVLDLLKLRAAKLSVPAKKTEVMRAGIKALAAMTDSDFLAAIRAVPNLKTGRPTKA